MGTKNIRCFKFISVASVLWFLCQLSVAAVPWQSIVQPHGTQTSIMTGAAANAGFPTASPPWDTATDVTVTKTDRVEQYVRLYNPGAGSNQAGRWIMRAADVRGKTIAQLRDDFALPALPTNITIVRVPVLAATGTEIWTGIAGPIVGWGPGGAEQFYLNGSYIPMASYFDGQALTNNAMSYADQAAPGNNKAIAAYLDSYIPQAYSDLENVYNVLDAINYGDRTNLQNSINQIGPSYYDAVGETILNMSRLFSEAARRNGSQTGREGIWFEYQNGLYQRKTVDDFAGYTERINGMAFGWTAFAGEKLSMGAAFGELRADTNRASYSGSYGTDTQRLALYSSYKTGKIALSTQVSAGFGKTAAKRNINIYGTDSAGTAYSITRTASSTPKWRDMLSGLSAEGDYSFLGMTLNPYAAGWYSTQKISGFTEQGADSLNLTVSPITRQTWILETGLGLAKTFTAGSAKIKPFASAGWEYFAPCGGRTMTSSLADINSSFSIDGLNRYASAFSGTIGAAFERGRFSLAVYYKGEFRDDSSANTMKLDTGLAF